MNTMKCPDTATSKQRLGKSRVQRTREPELPLPFAGKRSAALAGAGVAEAIPDEPSPEGTTTSWNVRIPVFQWEIDPTDTVRHCGSAELKYLGWDFRMWWEKHPVGLIYASIQAIHGSREKDWQGAWLIRPSMPSR